MKGQYRPYVQKASHWHGGLPQVTNREAGFKNAASRTRRPACGSGDAVRTTVVERWMIERRRTLNGRAEIDYAYARDRGSFIAELEIIQRWVPRAHVSCGPFGRTEAPSGPTRTNDALIATAAFPEGVDEQSLASTDRHFQRRRGRGGVDAQRARSEPCS